MLSVSAYAMQPAAPQPNQKRLQIIALAHSNDGASSMQALRLCLDTEDPLSFDGSFFSSILNRIQSKPKPPTWNDEYPKLLSSAKYIRSSHKKEHAME